MKISMLKTIEGNTVQQVNDRLHLLSPSAPEVEEKRLAQLIQDADFTLFVAKDDAEKIVGMLTLTPDEHGTDGFFIAKMRKKSL